MKVLSVLRADSVRAFRTIGDFGYLPDAYSALAQEYGFIGIPKLEEMVAPNSTQGVVLKGGKCELGGKIISIDFLQIYPTGLGITTHTNTSDSDAILEHVLNWAQTRFKLQYEPLKPGVGHASQLEVRLEKPLSEFFLFLSDTGKLISEGLDDFWELRPAYELTNINFWYDKNKFPQFAPPIFRLDRRDGVSFEDNVYYAEAPLTTDKHRAVLTNMEHACLRTLSE